VGRTEGSETLRDEFVNQVRSIVVDHVGDDEGEYSLQVTPRGSKFTKVSVETTVCSASIITSIYENLKAMELSVMQF
jgi:putative lipoic acid-binding regulatory protein